MWNTKKEQGRSVNLWSGRRGIKRNERFLEKNECEDERDKEEDGGRKIEKDRDRTERATIRWIRNWERRCSNIDKSFMYKYIGHWDKGWGWKEKGEKEENTLSKKAAEKKDIANEYLISRGVYTEDYRKFVSWWFFY